MARKVNQPDPASADSPKSGAAEPVSSQTETGSTEPQAGTGEAPAAAGSSAAEPDNGAGQRGSNPSTKTSAGGRQTSPSSADLLKQILEGYLQTSTLQSDYQTLYRSLPTVVGIASQILKKKEAGDSALDEGMQAVEKILGDARDKAEQLSKAMADQQNALEQLLSNKASLTELLKASQLKASETAKGLPQYGLEAAALADPKVAYQLNTLMGNINSMVQREVERQLSGLQSRASSLRK